MSRRLSMLGVAFAASCLPVAVGAQETVDPPQTGPVGSVAAGPDTSLDAQVAASVPVDTPPGEAPAAADDGVSTSPRPGMLGEIVVTAQRREQNINDVPISMNAFSGDALESLGLKDTRDLGNLVPGFTVSDSAYAPIYTLRGVGFNDQTYTASPTVGVYVDEVPLPFSIESKGASLDLERVEVLKGPQGILYGRNTTGGAINNIAKKPTSTLAAGLSGGYGRFGASELQGFLSGPLLGDARGRIAVLDNRSSQGWQTSRTRPGDHLGKVDKQAFRAAIDWQAVDSLFVRLVADGWRDASDSQAAQVIQVREQNATDPVGAFIPIQARNYPVIDQDGASPRVADWPDGMGWELDQLFLSQALRVEWQATDRTQLTTILSHLRIDDDKSEIPYSGFDFYNIEQILTAHIETSSIESRLAGSLGSDDTISWLVGGNASRDRGFEYHYQFTDSQSGFFPDPVTGLSTLARRAQYDATTRVRQAAAFANVGWTLMDGLTLTGGGRYTDQRNSFDTCVSISPDSPMDLVSSVFTGLSAQKAAAYTLATGRPGRPSIVTTGDCLSLGADGNNDRFRDSLHETNTSLRLALDWKPTDDMLLYLSGTRGYKAGSYPAFSASDKVEFEPAKQEELNAFETGAKVTLLDGQFHGNTAVYYYKYRDKQLLTKILDPIFGPLPILKNAPKSRVYGAEADVSYSPAGVEGLSLAGTVAYTYTEIQEFDSLDSAGRERDFAGRPFNFAPRWQYTLLANYEHPVTPAWKLFYGVDWYHSSKTSSVLDEDPIFRHDAYGLLGARLGARTVDGRWTVAAAGRNLTNELYTVSVLNFGDSVGRRVGRPRTYMVTLTWRWD